MPPPHDRHGGSQRRLQQDRRQGPQGEAAERNQRREWPRIVYCAVHLRPAGCCQNATGGP